MTKMEAHQIKTSSKRLHPLPVVLDVDTGRDDAWTILGAIRNNLDIAAITVSYGNKQLGDTVANTLDVVALGYGLRPDKRIPPIWAGASEPITIYAESLAEIQRRANIGHNGMFNVRLPAGGIEAKGMDGRWKTDFITHLKTLGQVDYVCCAPLTNLAELIDAFGVDDDGKPEILQHIRRVVAMGGSFAPGTAPDFNFHADPAAASRVLKTFGTRATILPFDDTEKLGLSEADIAPLKAGDLSAEFSKAMMLEHVRKWAPDGITRLHDPMTLIALEGHVKTIEQKMRVRLKSPHAGKLIYDDNGINVTRGVITDVSATRLKRRILSTYLNLK